MDISFQEKSAWGLLLAIVTVSSFYFPIAFDAVGHVSDPATLIGISVFGIIALVIIEAIYHAIFALPKGKELPDERDKLIELKAERNSSYALGFGLFWLVGHIMLQSALQAYPVPEPLTIAVYILLALTVSEVVKLAYQIWYYRSSA